MESIGAELREARERLGLTLEEVERAIRIRIHHLEHIERGELDALPSPVQARGFLRNYADFLGLDTDRILLRYADGIVAGHKRPKIRDRLTNQSRRPSVRIRSRLPRWLSTDLFITAGVILAIVTVILWGIGRVMASGDRSVEAEGEAGSPVDITPTPTAVQAATSLPIIVDATAEEPLSLDTSTPLPEVTIGPGYPISLRIQAVSRAWLEVIVDGEERIRGRVEPGEVLDFQARELVELRTGNAGGLRVIYNGQDQGYLGRQNQVVVYLWNETGMLTPTPTITSTPTVTSAASATSAATSTSAATMTTSIPLMTETPSPEPGG